MTNYSDNVNGFIYVACHTARWNEVISRYLEPVETKDIHFCLGRKSKLRRRDKNNIAKAHALLIFLTKELLAGNMLEDIVAVAVEHNKPMLIVHLDDVELDSMLAMQTDAQQALFRSRYKTDEELIEEIKKAAIFDNVQATPEQKAQQKRRTRVTLIAATAAALLAAIVILKMTYMIPDDERENVLGLWGVSERDLAKVEEIHICGTEILEPEGCEYERHEDSGKLDTSRIIYYVDGERMISAPGEISDLSGIEKLKNLRSLALCGQQIENIDPVVGFYERKAGTVWGRILLIPEIAAVFDVPCEFDLSLRCNPISSIDGLEKVAILRDLDISYTNVSELPEGLDVRFLNVAYTPLTDLSVVNDYENLAYLTISHDMAEMAEDVDDRIKISIE